MFLPLQIRTYPSEIKINRLRILLFSFWMLLFGTLEAQQSTFTREEVDPFYQRYQLQPGSKSGQRMQPSMKFTSLAFTLPEEASFAGFYCVVAEDTFKVEPAVHQPEEVEGVVSELLIFEGLQSEFLVLGKVKEEQAWVHLMLAEPLPNKKKGSRQRLLVDPCEKPEAVSQSVWRQGLPEPQYQRDFNEVEHLIVHHSAGSNQASNYTEVVRNIYLYHTRVNGWSDIGYNYLIAPDGTLFAGRDPGVGEQDNVRGAHFCGKNSQTMGVCLLGDFSVVEPSLAALQRLEQLLSWKSLKEELNPLEAFSHPANPELEVIAGHRDGCATACPGDQVYQKLPELRLAIAANIVACVEKEEESEVWVYFASKQQEVCLGGIPAKERQPIKVFNIQGKEVVGAAYQLESKDFCFKLTGLPSGIYFVQTERGRSLIRKKFMVF